MDTVTASELEGLLSARAKTYALLSRIFRVEADQALLDELAALDLSADPGEEDLAAGYALWRRFLTDADEMTLLECARDYVRVFIGAGRNAQEAAYPYESVYTSAERILMQEARDEVFAIYANAGLSKGNSWTDPEDHLALELEFMAFLCNKTSQTLAAREEATAFDLLGQQKVFLEEHPLRWVPRNFKDDLARFASTDLYRGLAYVTAGFLRVDAEFLADIVSDGAEREAVSA